MNDYCEALEAELRHIHSVLDDADVYLDYADECKLEVTYAAYLTLVSNMRKLEAMAVAIGRTGLSC